MDGSRRWQHGGVMNESQTVTEPDGSHKRLQEILRRISTAESRAGRSPGGTRLVAISKTRSADTLGPLIAAGQRRFGENRIQEAAGKIAELAHESCEWHLVGHLQSNKAREAARLFHWIHSLDNVRLAEKLSAASGAQGLMVLAQVDLAQQEGRAGVSPARLNELLQAAGALPGLTVRGLMVLPPMTEDPRDARPFFRRLRKLAETAATQGLLPTDFDLSMGMSRDYEVAVEEGATLVRVGTALFGPRESVSG